MNITESNFGNETYFSIDVINNCAHTQAVGLFQINADYSTAVISPLTAIGADGGRNTFSAPFAATGLRLATKQEQFVSQNLVEFGYSTYAGQEGTAYDLSLFDGTFIEMKVVPSDNRCETKICTSQSCPSNQAWTNPAQMNEGSPADTVCYHGKINFTVYYCPKDI